VLLQLSLGIATVHFGVPLPLATLHNAGAAFLIISIVILLRALWPQTSNPARNANLATAPATAIGA
jgi:cytochrome c oxidase assembly protein subunit 15